MALRAAMKNHAYVMPLYLLDPILLDARIVGSKRRALLLGGLKSLANDLVLRGSQLVIRSGKPQEVFNQLKKDYEISAIYAEEDFSPYARQRDKEIAQDFPLVLIGHPTVYHPSKVLKNDGNPYVVYSPFMHVWRSRNFNDLGTLISTPEHIPSLSDIHSDPLPETGNQEHNSFVPGETAAQHILSDFLDGTQAAVRGYKDNRDRMDRDLTSHLSPYLKFGMISVRQVIISVLQAIADVPGNEQAEGIHTWLNQIIWRDFYYSILYHYPHVVGNPFREKYANIPWIGDKTVFDSWKVGMTGYPIVDAANRQLINSGWVHNRARMITASFLTKNLLIDWRCGEAWYMHNLVDADLANNNGGWQWVAGCGTDAAPYFRIFNPITQSQKFDPMGEYIRRWVPELQHVPDDMIHTPWKMSAKMQAAISCIIGKNYPHPIIELKFSRQRVLNVYKQSIDEYYKNMRS